MAITVTEKQVIIIMVAMMMAMMLAMMLAMMVIMITPTGRPRTTALRP